MKRLMILVVLLSAVLPSPALASTYEITDDCQDGRIDKKYSQKELRKALNGLSVDLDEYTNCRELIRAAAQGVAGGGGSGPGGAGEGGYGALPAGQGGLPLGPDSKPIDPAGIASKEEQTAVEEARSGAGVASTSKTPSVVNVAGKGLSPGEDRSSAGLPVPLIVLLALTALGALAALVPRVKDLVLRRPAA